MFFRVLLLGSIFVSVGALAEPRPRITGVSTVRIANYGAPSVLISERDKVGAVLEELNRLRARDWRRGEAKLTCYSHLVLMRGEKKIGEFRIRREAVVERSVEKGQPHYSLDTAAADMPVISGLLAGIPPMKDCD